MILNALCERGGFGEDGIITHLIFRLSLWDLDYLDMFENLDLLDDF